MSATEYYNHATFPPTGASLSSSAMRAELELIEVGFGKLPDLSGNGGEIVAIKSDASGMESIATTGTGSVVRATSPTITTPVLVGPVEVRDGTNAQILRVYHTYTDASNYERGFARWSGNVFEVGSENAGTGVVRSVRITAADTLAFSTNGTQRWFVSSGGHLFAQADNTYDIGASGTTRPRSVYAGTSFVTGSVTLAGSGAGLTVGTAGSTTTAQIVLNGTTMNWINLGGNGVAAPAFTTRSAGTRLVLLTGLSGSAADYGMGIESNTMWYSVPTTAHQHKWYGGTTAAATLTGAGALTLTAGLIATTGAFSGVVSMGNTVNAVSPTSPNRTITISVGGTTYYIHAKTTND